MVYPIDTVASTTLKVLLVLISAEEQYRTRAEEVRMVHTKLDLLHPLWRCCWRKNAAVCTYIAEIERSPFTSHYIPVQQQHSQMLIAHSWEFSSRASRIAQPDECDESTFSSPCLRITIAV